MYWTKENFVNLILQICTSMASPWNVMSQLEKWVSVLQDHLDQLALPGERVRELRAAKQLRWEIRQAP